MTHTTQRSHEDNPQGPKVSVTRDDPRAATIEEIQPIVDRGDQGYAETLTNRQVQMMAIGGAIGVGLFLGAGSRLRSAGPAVLISYAFCAVIAFLVMRALGELVIHRPSSGSFVSYARELLGDRWAYAVGWMYMLNWMTSGIAELTAIGTYLQFWWPSLPMWVPSLVALMILVSVNLISVKAFGEFEFWAALLKVVALTAFIIVAIGLVASTSTSVDTAQRCRTYGDSTADSPHRGSAPHPGHPRCHLRLCHHRVSGHRLRGDAESPQSYPQSRPCGCLPARCVLPRVLGLAGHVAAV